MTGARRLHTIRGETPAAPAWLPGSGVDMTSDTLRLIIAASLFLHAIAHALALFALLAEGFGSSKGEVKGTRSGRLLPPNPRAATVVGLTIWAASTMGFLAASAGFWGILAIGATWRTIAVTSACVSTLGIVVRGGAWPGSGSVSRSRLNTLVAMTMNTAIFVALAWVGWPPPGMFGR